MQHEVWCVRVSHALVSTWSLRLPFNHTFHAVSNTVAGSIDLTAPARRRASSSFHFTYTLEILPLEVGLFVYSFLDVASALNTLPVSKTMRKLADSNGTERCAFADMWVRRFGHLWCHRIIQEALIRDHVHWTWCDALQAASMGRVSDSGSYNDRCANAFASVLHVVAWVKG